MSIGRSKAKVYVETDTKTTFDDVAGVDEAKEELKEIVDFLKDPDEYGRLGARMPKGVLLVGPPGTGKTLLARAVAGEAGVPFFSINGSEFVEMFVGVGAARVRDLFEQAREKAPAIIFIDELDALGRARGAYPYMGPRREGADAQPAPGRDSTASIRAAASCCSPRPTGPEILDPALLRAGRFDRQVLVDRPDKSGRIEILNLYLKRPQARRRRLGREDRGADARLHRRRPRQSRQRGGAGRDAAQRQGSRDGRFHRGASSACRRPREEEPRPQPQGARGRRLSRNGPRAGGDVAAGRRPGAQDFDHPARRRRARLHDPAPDRGPLRHHARRAARQDGGAARRPRRRMGGLRPALDRRGRRPRQGDRHRARHGRRASAWSRRSDPSPTRARRRRS